MVFPFFPIPCHRVYAESCFFGHVLATWSRRPYQSKLQLNPELKSIRPPERQRSHDIGRRERRAVTILTAKLIVATANHNGCDRSVNKPGREMRFPPEDTTLLPNMPQAFTSTSNVCCHLTFDEADPFLALRFTFSDGAHGQQGH